VNARQYNHQRNFSPLKDPERLPQNGSAFTDVPLGTKLEGFIDNVKEKFGFIRCVNKACIASRSWFV
jgi:hypothetical protein